MPGEAEAQQQTALDNVGEKERPAQRTHARGREMAAESCPREEGITEHGRKEVSFATKT